MFFSQLPCQAPLLPLLTPQPMSLSICLEWFTPVPLGWSSEALTTQMQGWTKLNMSVGSAAGMGLGQMSRRNSRSVFVSQIMGIWNNNCRRAASYPSKLYQVCKGLLSGKNIEADGDGSSCVVTNICKMHPYPNNWSEGTRIIPGFFWDGIIKKANIRKMKFTLVIWCDSVMNQDQITLA